MFCSYCNSNLLIDHILEDHDIPPMSNKSKIIYPKCTFCSNPIQLSDVSTNIKDNRKVLLITGTAGAGKTAIGQFIENSHNYIFIDGDAVQKRVNYFAKRDPSFKMDYQAETINTYVDFIGIGIRCRGWLYYKRRNLKNI